MQPIKISIGPAIRMRNWNQYKDFPSRHNERRLLLIKDKITRNTWLENLLELSKWRRPACKTLWTISDISVATARVATDPLKVPTRYKCQKICSWWRRPETILEIREKATFLELINKPITNISKILLTSERTLTGRQFLALDLSPTFLPQNETFPWDAYWRVQLIYAKVLLEEPRLAS